MEVFTHGMRKLWKDCQLRVLVLLSLALQIVLIIFGNRKKHTRKPLTRFVVWCAYLSADFIATAALGVILTNIGDIVECIGKEGSRDVGTELSAFWAPFLLLHLGGPDTITAYSLEDNELWRRHFLGLIGQTVLTLYIFLMAWNGSTLSLLSILMFCAGIIKYGERTWILRSASNKQVKASMLTRPNVTYLIFAREYVLKQFEGFYVKIDETNERSKKKKDETNEELVQANYLFRIFKRLFVDLTLNFDVWYSSRLFFKEISWDKAFELINIELGFMYDVLYTKATIIHSRQGWVLRLISFSLTCAVLVFFSMIDKPKYSNVDQVITFLLLSVGVLLELYAIVLLLSSDWTRLWLSNLHNHKKTSISQVLTRLQLLKTKNGRWSNTISQFNLLSVSLNVKLRRFSRILKFLHIDEVLEKYCYTTHKEVTKDLKILIFQHLKEKFLDLTEISAATEMRNLCSYRGDQVLKNKKYDFPSLIWSINIEFNQSILIWHIATDICYHEDNPDNVNLNSELSQLLSQYMLYLLAVCGFMSEESEMIRFHDTCDSVRKSSEEHNLEKSEVCKKLLEQGIEGPSSIILGNTSTSVLLEACRLASELNTISDTDKKWEMISNVWVEMLAYTAGRLTGTNHAQQLKSGGEFLTHVWLLMAHFGLNELFDISEDKVRTNQLVLG